MGAKHRHGMAAVGWGLPPWAASFLVMALAGRGSRIMQGAAAGIALLLAWGLRLPDRMRPGAAWLLAALLGLPLLLWEGSPARWVQLLGFRLYLAPVVVPALVVLGRDRGASPGPWVLAGLLLALQPDPVSLLALCAGGCVAVLSAGLPPREEPVPGFEEEQGSAHPGGGLPRLGIPHGGWWIGLLLVGVAVGFRGLAQTDPLAPLPHVEQVFALGFRHGVWPGMGILVAALVFLGGLARLGHWEAVAVYGVWYLGSLAGRVPAPLVGFGAAPILGFGLLCAVIRPASRA